MPWPDDSSRSNATPELPALIVIAGATATGKSALALGLAERFGRTEHGPGGVEIVSADSRQVYRGMDIGTAKPSAAERATVPHHCLDLVDPDGAFTAADFRLAAIEALRAIAAREGIALLVGGTGLYLRVVARGLPLEHAGADPDVRATLEARHAASGLEPLVAELEERDAAAAERIDRRNPRRVIRALERAIVTGTAVPPEPMGYPAPVLWLGLTREPAEHHRAIAARVDLQFATGLLDEAGALRERYPEDLPAFSAMGYREAFDVLAGRADLDTAKATDVRRTWAYAKRQVTWFRREAGIQWLEAGEGAAQRADGMVDAFLRAIWPDGYAGGR